MSIEEFNMILENGTVEEQRAHHGDPEHRLQCQIIRYFRLQYADHMIMAIPNAGKRSLRMGAYMKAEGLLPGIPDLLIPVARCGFNNLWVEVKNGKKGRLSDAQKEAHAMLTAQGGKVVVVRYFEDFVEACKQYFGY